MKLVLIRSVIIYLVVFFKVAQANDFNAEYSVVTSGIKIGKLTWFLEIKEDEYRTEINLGNSGFLSPLYSFKGKYSSKGVVENNKFKSKKYKQYWETKKKVKIVEMSFDDRLVRLVQTPEEKELSRLDLNSLFQYFDPLTSFINILKGANNAKTIDGRRIYTMRKNISNNLNQINIKIDDYKNIWADHRRNDLEKIEFLLEKDVFLPTKILVYFKDRVFKLKKI